MLPRSTACRHGEGWAWAKGDVDQQQLPVADHEVPRLDVAVRDAGVPQLPDQQQPLVDDVVVDLRLADFDGTGEELGDEQVFPLRGDLHGPVRCRGADPGVAQQAEHIVLVLGELPHGRERVLVLHGAVPDGAPQLVPAVGADVPLGVQLGEQELLWAAAGPQPQRGRAGRRFQADRLDLGHVQPELVAHAPADRLPPAAGHIDVRGAPAPVHDREHLVRGEKPERGDRDRHREHRAEEHVAGVIDPQVHAGQGEHGHRHGRGGLGPGPGAARHRQAVDHAHQEHGEVRHRRRPPPHTRPSCR